MISCLKCATQNTLDSAFCRKCGAGLPADLIQVEQTKLEELVGLGMVAFNEGRSDEAAAIAETAVQSNPAYANAHALKGMVHERKGEYAEALDSFETVVALNPDSAIDKIKLNQLRTAIANRAAKAPEPDKRFAWVMGVSAAVLVLSISILIAKYTSKGDGVVQNPDVRLLANRTNPSGSPTSAIESQNQPQQNGASNQSQPSQTATGQPGAGDVPAINSEATTNRTRPSRQGTGLQPFDPGAIIQQRGDLTPLPPGDDNRDRQNERPPVKPDQGPKDPPPSAPDKPATAPVEKPGTILITPSNGSDPRPSAGGGENIDGGNSRENLIRVGGDLYTGGDLSGAARAYERAISAGADPGRFGQRLGDIYRRLGQKSDAIRSYESALNVYESRKGAGKGDPEATQRSIDACRQAIKVLKG